MPLNRDKLIKICNQFGSDMPAIRAQAAETANRMLQEANMTWEQLLTLRETRPLPRRPTPPEPPPDTHARRDAEPPRPSDDQGEQPAMPGDVIGAITVVTNGPPMTIMLDDGQTQWGPIAVTRADLVLAASERGFRMRQVWIRRESTAALPEAYRII